MKMVIFESWGLHGGCRTDVQSMPYDQDIMGLNPTRCLAFSSINCVSLEVQHDQLLYKTYNLWRNKLKIASIKLDLNYEVINDFLAKRTEGSTFNKEEPKINRVEPTTTQS